MGASLPRSDAGGVAARIGFKHQDHVAASFVLQMLADRHLIRLECETADDILLVRDERSVERPEYVQVKTTEGNTRWSTAQICKRASAHAPTSLIEKSLLADCQGAGAQFRIVSSRDVDRSLSCLKLPREDRGSSVNELARKLVKKWSTRSSNGNDLAYWTANALWQVTGDMAALAASNMQELSQLAEHHGASPTHSHLKEIYESLLAVVEGAALARAAMPKRKVITRAFALKWWGEHLARIGAANAKTSKPYLEREEPFLAELHDVADDDLKRALTGYDVCYEREKWRSEQLSEYLADWLPEVALKASELVAVNHLNLRHTLRKAVRAIGDRIEPARLLAETLLHAVIRQRFQSEPIACKLFYRAAGTTGIFNSAYIVHGEPQDELWIGRATIAAADTYDSVLDAVLTELASVLKPEFLKEEREVILTLREPSHLLPTTLEGVLRRHTPVDELMKVLCVPILVAYDSEVLGRGFAKEYRDHLIKEIAARYAAIEPRFPVVLAALKVHVFFVPIECVATLARQFMVKIGMA